MDATPDGPPEPAPVPPSDAVTRTLGALALLAAATIFAWRLHDAGFLYDLWSDRDLARATQVGFDALPTHGAELSYGNGARIPGGLQYVVLAPIVALAPDPADTYRVLVALEALGVGLLAWAIGRRLGLLAGGFTALAWVASLTVSDSLTRIWNPSLVPLFAVLAWVSAGAAVADRRGVALVGLIATLVAGGQMHLSMLLLAPPLFVGALLARPRSAVSAVLAGLALGVVLQGPWLWSHLRGDVVVPGSFAEQAEVVRVVSGQAVAPPQAAGAARGLARLLPGATPGLEVAAWLAAIPTVAGLLAAAFVARRGSPPTRRVARLVLVTLALFFAYYAWDDQIEIDVRGTARYLLPLLPAAAMLAGVGATALVAVGRRGGRAGAAITAVVLATSGASAFAVARAQHLAVAHGVDTFPNLRALLDELRAARGASLADVASRTVLLFRAPDGYTWEARAAVDYLIGLEGRAFPGSGAPPCLAVVPRRDDPAPVAPAELARWIGADVGEVRIDAETTLPDGRSLVVYTPDVWPCRTSFVDPYLTTPVEDALLVARATLPGDGTAAPLPAPDGVRRLAFRLPKLPEQPNEVAEVVGAVDLQAHDAGTRVTLHALQLRGSRFNRGWFADAAWRDPELVVLDAGVATVVPLAKGLVGLGGAATPLTVTTSTPIPDGAELRLRTHTLAVPLPVPLPEGAPREVVLTGSGPSAIR